VVWPDDEQPAAGKNGRRRQTAKAVGQALGAEAEVRYRPDGRPEVTGGATISSSHGAGVTFAVAGGGAVACDVEVASARSDDDWSGLLGSDGLALAKLVAKERDEDVSVAATRVWGAVECLRKTGHASVGSLTLTEPRSDRWVVLRAGSARIATFPTALRDVDEPVVFSMLTEGGK
jgi:enediyne polyketide synthase